MVKWFSSQGRAGARQVSADPGSGQPAVSGWGDGSRDARTTLAFLCGATTITMLRPSCFGDDSTKPSSWMSSASRCSSRKPSSGLDCSRVRVDLRPELHLLDDGEGLVAAGLTRLLRALVLELAVVHELADRRPGHRGDLDQVELCLLGQPERILDAHDADLLPLGTDEPHFGDADPVVDAGLSTDGAS